jgi:D-threonate/D-erythronate kinase
LSVPLEVMDCALIADDLTGACDAAIQFKIRGVRSVVYFDVEAAAAQDVQVQAFTTETRDLEQNEVELKIRELAVRVSAAQPRIVFKKVDSLLRGNPRLEIAAALDAFGCDVAIITPAYPDLGRTVWDGHLQVDGDAAWKPIDVASLLGSEHTKPEGLADALRNGVRYVSVDSTSNSDLALLADEGLRSGRRVLWVGSGGLASALAEMLFGPALKPAPRKPQGLPVLFCIGSDHPVTAVQLVNLRERHAVCISEPEGVAHSLRRGTHTLLPISRTPGVYESLRLCLRGINGLAGAMLLSGGDSASTVCRALAAEHIELENQVVAGVPWGILKGGLLDGMVVATKSGAFGGEDTLVEVADFFA